MRVNNNSLYESDLCAVHVYVCLCLLDCLSKLLTDRKWRTDGLGPLAGRYASAGRSAPRVHLLEEHFSLDRRMRSQDIVSIHRNSYFLPHESKNTVFLFWNFRCRLNFLVLENLKIEKKYLDFYFKFTKITRSCQFNR